MECLTTEDLIKQMEKLGYSHEVDGPKINFGKDIWRVGTVRTDNMLQVDTDGFIEKLSQEAFDLLIRYANTPLCKREPVHSDDVADLEQGLINKQNKIEGLKNEIRGLKKEIAEQNKTLNELGNCLREYQKDKAFK